MTMANQVQLVILSVTLLTLITPARGQLGILTNDDNPSLFDRFLQMIWEPSSLIRMWVGLDQLYNIALSWRTAAKKLASLPFGEDRSMDHVKIQEPRSLKYAKPSVASQWDRFNKIYDSSNLSPIVANARYRQLFHGRQLGNLLASADHAHSNTFRVNPDSGFGGLPPAFLFRPQEVFVDKEPTDLLVSANEVDPPSPFGMQADPLLVSKLQELQKLKLLQNRLFFSPTNLPKGGSLPMGALNASPQEKLNMFLKLLKTLGDMHARNTNRGESGNIGD